MTVLLVVFIMCVCGVDIHAARANGVNVKAGTLLEQRYKRETGPACNDGWMSYEQSCYLFNFTFVNPWTDALADCQSRGAYLLEIKSEAENTFIQELTGGMSVLSGLSRYVIEENTVGWIWNASDTLLSTGNYTGWATGQPMDVPIPEYCAMLSTYGWLYEQCYYHYGFVCEKAGPVCDGEWMSYNQSCYLINYMFGENLIYALADCQSRGAYLLEIESEAENTFITDITNGMYVLFGLSRYVIEENTYGWIWTTSNTLLSTGNYTGWDIGQPMDVPITDYCVTVDYGSWYYQPCYYHYGFVCEKDGIVECETNMCLNGGSCTEEAIGYTCACVNGYGGSNCETALFTVETCTTNSVVFTVYAGHAGGVTYIEGSTENCTHTLFGFDSQSISTEYSTCGLDPTNDTHPNVATFVIAVNGNAGYTTSEDARYKVECIFGDNDNVVVTIEAGGKSKSLSGDDVVTVETHPEAELKLYVKEDDTGNYVEITSSTVISVGQTVRLELTLITSIPNYNVLIKNGSLEAKTLTDVLLKSLQLIDDITFCSILLEVFPDFQYSTKELTIDGVTTIVPVATTEYVVFLPTVVGLTDSEIKLVMKITVAMCFGDSLACAQPTCGVRRRRAIASSDDDNFEEPVSKSFIFKIDNPSSNEEGDVSNTAEATLDQSESVTERTMFWAILISALLVAIIGGFITCCVCMNLRRRQRNSKETNDGAMHSNTIPVALEHDGWSRRGPREPRSMSNNAHASRSMPQNPGHDGRYYY